MRIGIDIREIYDPRGGKWGGIGMYTLFMVRELIGICGGKCQILKSSSSQVAISNQQPTTAFERGPVAAVATNNQQLELVLFASAGYDISQLGELPLSVKVVKLSNKKGLAKHLNVHKILKKENLDLLWGPANYVPVFYRRKFVITVHDLAIYAHPEWFPSGQWFSKNVLVPSSIRAASKIIAVSESTRQDIQKLFGIPSEDIEVIHEAPVSEVPEPKPGFDQGILERFGLKKGEYFVFLGTLEPRKNLRMLIEAYYKNKHENPDIKLVLGGKVGWNADKILASAREVGGVVLTDYLSKEEKWALLRNALALTFPSLYEGFGLPILEAQLAGIPVLTSEVSSMPEVGGDSVIYVDPSDLKSVMDGMMKLIKDEGLRSSLIQKGKENLKRFSWQKAARELLKLLVACSS